MEGISEGGYIVGKSYGGEYRTMWTVECQFVADDEIPPTLSNLKTPEWDIDNPKIHDHTLNVLSTDTNVPFLLQPLAGNAPRQLISTYLVSHAYPPPPTCIALLDPPRVLGKLVGSGDAESLTARAQGWPTEGPNLLPTFLRRFDINR